MLPNRRKGRSYGMQAARLERDGLFTGERRGHDHGGLDSCGALDETAEENAIACARSLGWDGFVELAFAEGQPARILEIWRFHRIANGTTDLQALGVRVKS